MKETERQRDLLWLVHSPDDHHGWGWDTMKPGILYKSLTWVVGAPSSKLFLIYQQGDESALEHPGLKLTPIMGAAFIGDSFTRQVTMLNTGYEFEVPKYSFICWSYGIHFQDHLFASYCLQMKI